MSKPIWYQGEPVFGNHTVRVMNRAEQVMEGQGCVVDHYNLSSIKHTIHRGVNCLLREGGGKITVLDPNNVTKVVVVVEIKD